MIGGRSPLRGQSGGAYEYFEYDFDEHHDATMNDMLPVDSARIWARAERRSVFAGGESAFVPDAVSTVIMLCVWSARKRFFRLKNLCDLAKLVDRSRAALDFAALVAQCREYRCDDIVLAALSAARACLGAALPDAVLDELANGRPRAALVRWLVQRRSFAPLRLFSFHYGQNQRWRRRIDQSLLLPYATYRPVHVAKRLAWVLRVKDPLQPAS